jgi:hypothetical protein
MTLNDDVVVAVIYVAVALLTRWAMQTGALFQTMLKVAPLVVLRPVTVVVILRARGWHGGLWSNREGAGFSRDGWLKWKISGKGGTSID